MLIQQSLLTFLPFSSCLYHVYIGLGSPLPEHVSLTYPGSSSSVAMEMGGTTGKAVVIYKIAAVIVRMLNTGDHKGSHLFTTKSFSTVVLYVRTMEFHAPKYHPKTS